MKMLGCVSGAEHSEEVVRFACRLARESVSRIILLHVRPPLKSHAKGYLEQSEIDHLADCLRALPEHVEQFVAAPCRAMEDAGATVDKRMMESDDPAQCILSLADEEDVDVIVIGATGHKLMEQLFQPSITARVLRRSRRPVLVVPYGSLR